MHHPARQKILPRRIRASLRFFGLCLSCIPLFTGLSGCEKRKQITAPPRIEVRKLEAIHEKLLQEIQPGDTIESLCMKTAGRSWPRWRDALVEELDPRALKPGLLFEGERDSGGSLRRLQVELDPVSSLCWEDDGDQISCRRSRRTTTTEIRRMEGRINSSLFASVAELGASPELAVRLASVFQWDIDFFRGLRKGDQFTVLIEEELIGDRHYRYGQMFAARFINDGRELWAVAWGDGDGRIGYYDLDGNALKKQFLRSPLKFSRITSRFSLHRYHPVLHRSMPHYGVDYGAPTGTPVHATADGVVTFAGRNGGAGKMVRIRHANGWESNYLHLSRYGRGIRRGVRVSQKQVIGYVGATGLATGPHLDYRVRRNGHWINPLSISLPPAPPLPEEILPRFLSYARSVSKLLEDGKPAPGAHC